MSSLGGIDLNVAGLDRLRQNLAALTAWVPDAVAAALYAEAEIEMTEAKKRCPVLTGALRASGLVSPPERSGRTLSVRLSFGGAAQGYAIYVHENLDAWHKNGQAKFLESVILESAQYIPDRVAARMQASGGFSGGATGNTSGFEGG